jgi:hypothetical protein
MKIRERAILISTLLISLCLVGNVPEGISLASTWRERYFDAHCFVDAPAFREQNFLMPLGFCCLGIEIIGLIVLWTGYRKKERSAWLVMLIILLFLDFPLFVLPVLLHMPNSVMEWSSWFRGIREGFGPSIWLALGVLNFLLMLVALLLPIKAFFWRSTTTIVSE